MNKITPLFTSLFLITATPLFSQIDARMFQNPDVSQNQIVFTYAGNIWIADKSGGQATKLSSPEGIEELARFSPDGKQIAFSANYHGNIDIYTIPVDGGLPERLTYHGFSDRIIDWHPDGSKILFASSRESGRQRFSQFFTIPVEGGLAEKLAIPYGENASYAPDGQKIAYTDKSRVSRTWKRYRGGMAPDITVFDLINITSEVVAADVASDEIPMWHDNRIYFMSDRGPEKRNNLWSYDLSSKEVRQLTRFEDFDIHYPSIGPEDIVFEAGGKLYLFNIASEQYNEVNINVVTDRITIQPEVKNVSGNIQSATISPDGNRVIVAARGELFTLPAEKGFVKNLTQTSGVAERHPAWSPDGKSVAFFSDKSGEYELTLLDLESGIEKKLSSYGPGFRYNLYWSPDSKKLAFVDQTMTLWVFDLETSQTIFINKGLYMFEGRLRDYSVSWSADSRWIAYDRDMERRGISAIFLYDYENKTGQQVTSGYYGDFSPVFDPEGKYLYFLTNRSFGPEYSDFDNSFIYPNATRIASVTLRKDLASPLAPENDDVSIEEEDKEEPESGKKKNKKAKSEKEEKEEEKEETKAVVIDLAGFEERLVLLPPEAGNYSNVQAVKGKVLYHRMPRTGSLSKDKSVIYWDLEEREEKTILGDVDNFMLAAGGEKILVSKNGSLSVIKVGENQKMDKKVPTSEMEMTVNPREEWRQIFNDAWRMERDYFYDKNMHGVDWDNMRTHYGKLVEDAVTREDVNYVIGELIGELSASHTYRGGGDSENGKQRAVGYLGVDWEISDGFYRIKKIIKGAVWDAEVRSPLAEPGIEVQEGNYILAVNGIMLGTDKEPFAAFNGLADKTVELLVNSQPSTNGARKVIVKTLSNETRLRHLAWIEANRKYVDEATEGQIGYIYVRSTGVDGQSELLRQFTGLWDKKGLIIDERFNSGGQIPDRFIELLNRKPLAFWAVRDGKDWQCPPAANFGPKVMLINGWSGSGGDAFPDYFKKAGLGPLIGSRTWGGLIGITGAPSLIDGGSITVPTFRMYDPDGKWFREGYGVDPDIEVKEDAARLAEGIDVQLERAVQEVMDRLDTSYKKPEHPAYEQR